ncbi:MAG: TonB-dependent receptor [Sphingobacteriales bacterium]|jgi:outer membrane receptor for ferrienterochelin and colicins|nr:TonB-dependent receptor [Sphingobacteriales bacterium]MBP6663869.1 TonB-dependent receptor [Chitinophagales bacterium]
MQNIFFILVAILLPIVGFAQNNFEATIKDADTKEVLIGATALLKGTKNAVVADVDGKVQISNVPNGVQTIVFSYVGYEPQEQTFSFPLNQAIEVLLASGHGEELEEIVISSTRASRTFDNTPTRIEHISAEEIDEKSNMRPTNVSMLLHESTGIQVQQTSYTSANQSIRIQGLDGRYTQILKDGLPVFGGFAGSLSILDIPPLDLRQVEVIKGSSSTLYGGGAIAGVVNFISEEPKEKRTVKLIVNQTSTLATDLSTFVSHKNKKFGYSVLGTANYQRRYDVDNDHFTELPETKVLGLNPKLFYYINNTTSLVIGHSITYQDRFGGDSQVIDNKADANHTYFERNKSLRNITFAQFNKAFNSQSNLCVKQTFGVFERSIAIPSYYFKGQQKNAFTDVSYLQKSNKHTLVIGSNLLYDNFTEAADSSLVKRDYVQITSGVYMQDNWDISPKLLLEGGFRLDYAPNYGVFPLPRLSALYKFNNHLSSRLGGGLGYKLPTIFSEQTESITFKQVLPINNTVQAEKSYGATFDVNYKNFIGNKFSYAINQLFFVTQLNKPLVLQSDAQNNLLYNNANQPIVSNGFETNLKLSYDFIKLFLGYTYTNAKATYLTGNQQIALLPKNKLNFSLIAEKHQNFKIGFEGFLGGEQLFSNGTVAKPYSEFGFFVEKTFGKISIYLNAENFTDTRQNRFMQVVSAPHTNPTFSEIYTHTEGRVFNGGVKIKL